MSEKLEMLRAGLKMAYNQKSNRHCHFPFLQEQNQKAETTSFCLLWYNRSSMSPKTLKMTDLVLSSSDGRLGLLDDDLLRLTLLALELQSLTTLQLYLTRLHQLDLRRQLNAS